MIRMIFSFFASRGVAVWLLVLMILALVVSTFLPSPMNTTGDEWTLLTQRGGLRYELARRLATPFMVKSTPFVIVSLLLFFSTLVCTMVRVAGWLRSRESEFTTEKAFTCTVDRHVSASPERIHEDVRLLLVRRRWESRVEDNIACPPVYQKGVALGFWGSVVFHVGLLFCFLAPLITSLTGFSGDLTLTEGITVGLREGVVAAAGVDIGHLPDVPVRLENLRGVYASGKYKLDFGGDLVVGPGGDKRLPFSVNGAVAFESLQFSLQRFGFSPQVVVTRGTEAVFDYFANLLHAGEGDWFPLGGDGDERLFLLFLPNFVDDGGRIGTRNQEPVNPRLALKIVRDGRETGRAIIAPGEKAVVSGYQVSFPELRRWAGLSVTRERGLLVLVTGFVLVVAGLIARFLSNERRLSVVCAAGADGGTLLLLRGYSRYYPAFLEREVREIATIINPSGLSPEDIHTARGNVSPD